MRCGLQWVVDKITFPSPPSSYSLTSHPELFFVKSQRSRAGFPGVPCMLYTIPQGAPVLLVHAHSNGCDIGDMRQTLQNISESLKVHVMSFEFPGYGLHLGTASMRSIDEAAIAVADFIANDLKVNPAQVVWYGRSIGSGPALRMAHRITKELNQQPGGLVVQCGYANFPEVAGHLFGRVAKQLVSPLWPNEAMMKELRCPVLLIHGRNDTMIPIAQSQKLWDGVKLKELSHFHTCDCGHNDFNFRRCTLRPIYDFLVKVISSAGFPALNFNVELPPSMRAYVHHIGALRSKIPVYSFRRPELEEYLRKLITKRQAGDNLGALEMGDTRSDPQRLLRVGEKAVIGGLGAEEGVQMNGLQGTVQGYDEQSDRWWLALETGEAVLLRARNLNSPDTGDAPPTGAVANGSANVSKDDASLKATGREVSATGTGTASRRPSTSSVDSNAAGKIPATLPPEKPPAPKAKAKKGKVDVLPIPDFTEMPQEEDISRALLDPEGMVRTCAARVGLFLDRIQGQLERIEGLEAKPLEEIIQLVEAEFWASDPLLGLWEEVSVPDGGRVRFRLGPFSVDSCGQRLYDTGLGAGRTAGPAALLRQPLWLFTPSAAHFRCLAEWSLLHSPRLERSLPSGTGASSSSSCCFHSGFTRTKKKPSRGGRRGEGGRPSRGALATSLAAHFVHWVQKKPEVKAVFGRFVELYLNPESSLRRSEQAAAQESLVGTRGGGPPLPLAPKELTCDMPPTTPGSDCEDRSFAAEDAPAGGVPGGHFEAFAHNPSSVEVLSSERGGQKPFFPCEAKSFSASSRALLRSGLGGLGSECVDMAAGAWGADGQRKGGIADFQCAAEMVADAIALDEHLEAQAMMRKLDWTVGGLLLHYERLQWGASPDGAVAPGLTEEALGDPLRADVRRAAAAVSCATKAFLQAELRERQQQLQSCVARTTWGRSFGEAAAAAAEGPPRPADAGKAQAPASDPELLAGL